MFSGRVHIRLVGLLVQALSYLFIFWSMNQYGGDCGEVVVVTVLPLAEVMGRIYYYCWLGQSIICAVGAEKTVVFVTAFSVILSFLPLWHFLSCLFLFFCIFLFIRQLDSEKKLREVRVEG